jgi:hypothetical protein
MAATLFMIALPGLRSDQFRQNLFLFAMRMT